jgi:hypothetical protein
MDPDSYCSIILLDDLAADVEFTNYKTRWTLDQAKDMVGLLAKMHGTFYGEKAMTDPRLEKLCTYASGFQGWHETSNVRQSVLSYSFELNLTLLQRRKGRVA